MGPSPWGTSEKVTEIAKGIKFVSTPSHGGFHVSAERMTRMPDNLKDKRRFGIHAERDGDGWFEEDFEVYLVVLAFPEECSDTQVCNAEIIGEKVYSLNLQTGGQDDS